MTLLFISCVYTDVHHDDDDLRLVSLYTLITWQPPMSGITDTFIFNMTPDSNMRFDFYIDGGNISVSGPQALFNNLYVVI